MKTQRLEKTFGILLALLLAIVLVACSTPEPTVDEGAGETATNVPADPTITPAVDTIENQLVGTNWELESMNGVEAGDDMTLSFGSGTISGSDGCNTFNGEYTIENSVLVIGDNIASTLMACPDVDAEMSQQFMNALASAGEFTLDNDDLTIQTENGELVFSSAVEGSDPTAPQVDTIENQIVGTNWELESMNGIDADDDMTLNFGSGTISGSDGCNTFSGGYTIENGMLVISDNLAMTAMACADVDAEMSQQYLNALVTAGEFTLSGDDLTIQTESGALVFERDDDMTDNSGVDTMVNQLATTTWGLVSMDGTEIDDAMTLHFEADTISGSDGCNSFSSDYTIGNGTLTISDNIASTLMACPDVDAEMAQQYLNALVSATAYILDGDSLIIQTDGGELVFAQMENAELDETRWQLESLVDSDGNITRLAIDGNIFLTFDDDEVNGNGGCNSFNGTMTTDDTQMSFGDIAATLMACADDDVNQRETEFFTALGDVASYEIIGQTLTLYDADGSVVATFVEKLTNTVWQWVRFDDTADMNNITVADAASYTVQFMSDGSYTLQADCNSGNGSYSHNGGSLTFKAGTMTLAECGEGSLSNEFISRLGDVVTYVFDDGNLVMNLKADAGNMVFKALND